MVNVDLAGALWRTSTYTQGNGACVEVALTPSVAGIRDSKQPDGGVVLAGFPAWDAFRRAVKGAELDPR
ncbi:DUF397 domain-containing protein [Actinophytocola glycyrrhizae]|uniref:DUF397 domain-containing protein n=1 Tax=Actinophytocola glycyrrhizae TaxID=2044873 RepID=A0ABV9RY62_9PSEU